jgi:hypothetical protein
MHWYHIRLHVARCEDYPQGSTTHGYDLVAPLTSDGHLDEEAWKAEEGRATVHRFWEGEEDERGHLIRTDRGNWAFSYISDEDEDDEPIFHLESHIIRNGEYITITEEDEGPLPFVIASVRPL